MKYQKQEIRALEKARSNLDKTNLNPIDKVKLFVSYSDRLNNLNRCKYCHTKLIKVAEEKGYNLYECKTCNKGVKI